MPKTIKEYIEGLRQYNPGITDTEITEYLISIGKNAEEVKNSLVPKVEDALPAALPEVVLPPRVESSTPLPLEGKVPQEILIDKPLVEAPKEEIKKPSDFSVDKLLQNASFHTDFSPKITETVVAPEVPKAPLVPNSVTAPASPNSESENTGFVSGEAPKEFTYPAKAPASPEEKYSEARFVSETVIGPAKPMSTPFQGSNNNPVSGGGAPVPQQMAKEGKTLKVLIVIVVILLVCALGGLGYIYRDKISSLFSGGEILTNENLTSKLFDGFSKLKNGKETGFVEMSVENKKEGIKTFEEAYSNSGALVSFKKDVQKFKEIKGVLGSLNTYFYRNKKYPLNAEDAGIVIKDELGLVYKSSADQKDFLLETSFESLDMIHTLKNYQSTEDKTKIQITSKDFYTFSNLNFDEIDPFMISGTASFFASSASGSSGMKARLDFDATSGESDGMPLFDVFTKFAFSGDEYDFKLAGSARYVKEGLFLKLSESPSFFGDFSKIKDTWIYLDPKEEFDPFGKGSNFFENLSSEKIKETISKTKDEKTEKILRIFDEESFIQIEGEPVKIKTADGKDAYEYTLKMHMEKLPQIYPKIAQELKLPESFLEEKLSLPLSVLYLKYLSDNQTFKVALLKNGTVVKTDYDFILLPSQTGGVQNKQVRFSYRSEHTLPEGGVNIQKPDLYITQTDAYLKIAGLTLTEFKYQRQRAAISQIILSLKTYKSFTGAFPKQLSDLLTPVNMKNGSSTIKGEALLRSLPKNVYEGKEIVYKTDEKGSFSLSYYIEIPNKEEASRNVPFYTARPKNITALATVPGINTATETVFSLEAEAEALVDTDKDLLSDSLEEFMGTNKLMKDTDADGLSDYSEFISGGDPLKK